MGKYSPSRKMLGVQNLQDILFTTQNYLGNFEINSQIVSYFFNKYSLFHYDKIIGALPCRSSYTVGFQSFYLGPVDVMHHEKIT